MTSTKLTKEAYLYRNTNYSTKFGLYLFYIYFFLSFFEGYINQLVTPLSKYFILLIIFYYIALMLRRKVTTHIYVILLLFWFALKNISLLWGFNNYYGVEIVNAHFASQTLMIILFTIISSIRFSSKFAYKLINSYLFISVFLAFLAIFYSKPFMGSYTARNTLTILGAQMDPNDLSAFYISCVTISLFNILFKKKKIIINFLFMLIGIFSMGMTSSRGGMVSLLIIVSIMLFDFILKKQNLFEFIKYLIVYIAMFVIIAFILKRFLPSEAYIRLFSSSYGDGSGRLIIWLETISAFFVKPILGFGWGGSYFRVHNTFLNILIDNGIVGLSLFLSSILVIILNLFRKNRLIGFYILLSSLLPALFIEGITKRFFWNGIILSIIILNSYVDNSESNSINNFKEEKYE